MEPIDTDSAPKRPQGHGLGSLLKLADVPLELRRKEQMIESSWDSTTWNRNIPKGMPLKPNRILHERHLRVMNQFRREVEVSPEAFADIITSRRQTSADS